MSAFGGLILTNRGRALQAKAQAGVQLKFTSIRVGDGQVGGQAISELTDLIHTVKTLDITKLKTLSGGKAVVGGTLSNSGLTTGFYWREIGVFAEDPDLGEILYCYGNAGDQAEYIPADGGADLIEKSIDVVILVGNASNISAVIDQSLIFVTMGDFLEHTGNTIAHVTHVERETWNAKETPAGAQAKADAAAAAAVAAHDTKEKHIAYAVASGTNTYTVSIPGITQLVEGMSVKIKFANGNTGASTLNINNLGAKNIVKGNGNALSSGNIKAGQILHLVYTGSNFQLLGEGGEYGTATPAEVLKGYTIGTENGIKEGTLELTGNASVGDVLAGKTFYNTNAKSKQTGTMPNNGSQSATLTITGSGKPTKTIPAGYTTGGTITAQLDPSLASVIKNAVTVGGVQGKYKGEYLVDDIVRFSFESTFAGIDNDYIYTTEYSSGSGYIRRYNHAGTLISAASLILGVTNTRGTYNREGAIFTRQNNKEARIYNHDGTLLYDVRLLANFIDHYTPMAGYANGKIAYQAASSNYTIRLETIGGTLLSTYDSNDMCYMFSNFKESIVAFYPQGDQRTFCYIPRNGNSIISSGFWARELLGHLQKFFL